jgi:hypothetical protein
MSLNKKINIREDESIIKVVRSYALALIWKYLLGLLFLGGSSFVMFQLFGYGLWGYAVYGVGMLLGVYIIFRTWFFGYFNMLVVTSERVVDIHRAGWFDVVVSSVSYQEIKDVAVRKKGLFSNLFNYGSVVIQGKSRQFVLEAPKVHYPQDIQNTLQEVSELYKQDKKVSNVDTIYKNFVKIISNLTDKQLSTVQELINNEFEEVSEEANNDDEEEEDEDEEVNLPAGGEEE